MKTIFEVQWLLVWLTAVSVLGTFLCFSLALMLQYSPGEAWMRWLVAVSGLLLLVSARGIRVAFGTQELVIHADFVLHTRRVPLSSIRRVTLHDELRPIGCRSYGWCLLDNGTGYLMCKGPGLDVEADRSRILLTSRRAAELVALMRPLVPECDFEQSPTRTMSGRGPERAAPA